MIYNPQILNDQLTAAGLPVNGANSNGLIFWQPDHPTPAEKTTADAILAAHDPFEYAISTSTTRIVGNGEDTAIISVHAPGEVAHLLVAGHTVDVQLTKEAGVFYLTSNSPNSAIEIKGAAGGLAACKLMIFVL